MRGIYVLIIQLSENVDLTIGSLGSLSFPEGFYAYVGSAQCGLEKRIKQHFRKEKRVFWHVDYLLQSPHSRIVKVFYKDAEKRAECDIATKIAAEGEVVTGFGCSDCNCRSHLLRTSDLGFLSESMQEFKVPKFSAPS